MGLGTGCQMNPAITSGFLHGLVRPIATDHIVGLSCCTDQVHGHDRVFSNGSTLQQQHAIIVWNSQQAFQERLGLSQDVGEFRPPVAHLHDGHAASLPIEHIAGSLSQNGLWQSGGAGTEIENAVHRAYSDKSIPSCCATLCKASSNKARAVPETAAR